MGGVPAGGVFLLSLGGGGGGGGGLLRRIPCARRAARRRGSAAPTRGRRAAAALCNGRSAILTARAAPDLAGAVVEAVTAPRLSHLPARGARAASLPAGRASRGGRGRRYGFTPARRGTGSIGRGPASGSHLDVADLKRGRLCGFAVGARPGGDDDGAEGHALDLRHVRLVSESCPLSSLGLGV